MTAQKQEIQQNLKKLQLLTADYEKMLQKEYEMQKMVDEIRESQTIFQSQQQCIEHEKQYIEQERQALKTDQLDAEKVRKHVARVEERAQMKIEDMLTWIAREKEKCQKMMEETWEMRKHLHNEKERWSCGVEDQQKKLELLVEDKRE